jgi:hypothetical protein
METIEFTRKKDGTSFTRKESAKDARGHIWKRDVKGYVHQPEGRGNRYHIFEEGFCMCSIEANIPCCDIMVLRAWTDKRIWDAAIKNGDYTVIGYDDNGVYTAIPQNGNNVGVADAVADAVAKLQLPKVIMSLKFATDLVDKLAK